MELKFLATEGDRMSDEAITAFEVLDRLSAAYYGKQVFFLENDGSIHFRNDGCYYDIEHAIREFESKLLWRYE